MGDSHVDHGPVLSAVVDPIGKRLALLQAGEIFGVHFPWLLLRSPRATRIFKGSYQFLLLHSVFSCRLMYPNWASRLACCGPSFVLRLACKESPISSRHRATVTHVTGCPKRVNSSAMVRVDLLVHRNRLIGSPAVVSSRIFSNRSCTPGSTPSTFFLPPPTRLTRPSPGFTSFPLLPSSSTAFVIVVRESPVNAARRLMPPRPKSSALSAANSLA